MKPSTKVILEKVRKVLVRKPLSNFRDIATGADIGRATLYRHFPNREILIETLALSIMDDIDEIFTQIQDEHESATKILRCLITRLIQLGDQYYLHALASTFANNLKVIKRYEEQYLGLENLIDQVKAEGSIKSSFPSSWVARYIDSLIYTSWTSIESEMLTEEEAVNHAMEALFNGLSPNKCKGEQNG